MECLRPLKDGLDEDKEDDERMEGDRDNFMVEIPAIVGLRLSYREI